MGADEEGNSKQQKDHSYDKADVKAVMNSMRKHVAVVVIAGKLFRSHGYYVYQSHGSDSER